MILRVLFVEDSETDAALILREVKRLGYEVESQRVQTAETMQAALTDKEWDIILCDYSMPSFNGSLALDVLKASGKDLPFIILSGTVGEEILADVMNSGAQDFILKDHLVRLEPVLHRELEEAKTRQKHRQAERALKESELKYRRLFESAKDGILILDYETGTIVDVNPYLFQLLGLKQEEILGKKLWDLSSFKDIAADQAKFLELQKQEFIRYDDLPLEDANGQSRRVEFVSNVYWVNNHKVIQCNIRDITERKQVEVEVKSLSNFPEENPDPVLRLSVQGMILYANRAGQAVLEAWKTEVGQTAPAFWSTKIAKAFETRSRQSIELSLGARIFSFTITPILDAGYVNLYGSDITQRKQAEAALQKSEEKFRELFNNANDAIYLWNLDEGGTILKGVEVNEVACKWMGYSKEEFLQLSPVDISAESIDEKIPVRMAPLLSQGHMITEALHRTKDGRIIPVEISARIVELMGEKKILSLARDITERKRAEEAIQFLASIVDSTDDAIIGKSLDGMILSWNPGAEKLYGYPAHEAIGKPISIILPPEKPDEMQEILDKVGRGEKIEYYETERLTRDGKRIDVSLTIFPVRDRDGRIVAASMIGRDITQRKRADEALLASELKYRRLFEAAKDGVLILDYETGTVVDVNPFLIELLGIQRTEFLGKKIWELGFFKDIVANQANFLELQKKEYIRYENLALESADGQRRNVEFVSNVYLVNRHKVIQCNIRDITERKQAEEKLRAAVDELERSNKELEQFAYVASHDLQEPLRMVSSYMQLIAKRYQGKLDSDADEFIAYAVDGALRMQRMINDLLAFSRVGRRGKPFQPVDTEAILNAALENLKLAIEDSRALVTHDPLPSVLADESQLAQLFQNLIGNALKFHGEEPPRVHVSARKTSEFWEFSVRDNGIGIDPQFFERVFLIFQRLSTRTEHAGSGIGLAICKKIVERHGGRIWIESKPGRGTTFFFTLPGA